MDLESLKRSTMWIYCYRDTHELMQNVERERWYTVLLLYGAKRLLYIAEPKP